MAAVLSPPPAEDLWGSDIAYTQSTNGGANWGGPNGGWQGYVWDNLSKTAKNSQMPSIACILDKYTGNPAQTGRNEFGYNSQAVHVVYNEDTGTGIQVYYIKSTNNGLTWTPKVGLDSSTASAYPNIAVDMKDNPHIVNMSNGLVQSEPLRSGAPITWYLAGINPIMARSFPGPYVGMYGSSTNQVSYAWNTGAWYQTFWTGSDEEFPTVALDHWQNVNVNWQQYLSGNYEIWRASRNNTATPANPVPMQVYGSWGGWFNDSLDVFTDDLFPNLAERKVAMYWSPNDQTIAGFDEVWTKVIGLGYQDAIAANPVKDVIQNGNMTWVDPSGVPIELSEFVAE